MSREAALEFVGRVVADGTFSDQLALALVNLTEPSQRLAALAQFAVGHGYEATTAELLPLLPTAPDEIAEADLAAVAGGVGSGSAKAFNCMLPPRFAIFGVICPEPPFRR